MDNLKIPGKENYEIPTTNKDNFDKKDTKKIVEIVDEEELKKIEAYLEWEQEYYVINQSYLLENI